MSWSWNELILTPGLGYVEINKTAMDDIDVVLSIHTHIDILIINVAFGSFTALQLL